MRVSRLRDCPLERLLRGLTALGRDVDIVIRPPVRPGGKLRIAGAEPA